MTTTPTFVNQVAEASYIYCEEGNLFDYCPGIKAATKFFMEQPESANYSIQWTEQTCTATRISSAKSRQRNTSNDQLNSLKALFKEYIVKNETVVQNQTVSLRNLEN